MNRVGPDRMILMTFNGVPKDGVAELANKVLGATYSFDSTRGVQHEIHTIKAYQEIRGGENQVTVAMLGLVDDKTDEGFRTFQIAQDLANAFPQGTFIPIDFRVKVETRS